MIEADVVGKADLLLPTKLLTPVWLLLGYAPSPDPFRAGIAASSESELGVVVVLQGKVPKIASSHLKP